MSWAFLMKHVYNYNYWRFFNVHIFAYLYIFVFIFRRRARAESPFIISSRLINYHANNRDLMMAVLYFWKVRCVQKTDIVIKEIIGLIKFIRKNLLKLFVEQSCIIYQPEILRKRTKKPIQTGNDNQYILVPRYTYALIICS